MLFGVCKFSFAVDHGGRKIRLGIQNDVAVSDEEITIDFLKARENMNKLRKLKKWHGEYFSS